MTEGAGGFEPAPRSIRIFERLSYVAVFCECLAIASNEPLWRDAGVFGGQDVESTPFELLQAGLFVLVVFVSLQLVFIRLVAGRIGWARWVLIATPIFIAYADIKPPRDSGLGLLLYAIAIILFFISGFYAFNRDANLWLSREKVSEESGSPQ